MPCTATARPNSPDPTTATPLAVTEQSAVGGQSPAFTSVSPPAPGSAMDAAGSTATALLTQYQALREISHVRQLSDSLYSSLSDNPTPTRQQAADWVRMAGEMHRHAQRSIVELVNVLTDLITTRQEPGNPPEYREDSTQ